MPDDLIKAGGALDVGNVCLAAENFTNVLKIGSGIQRIPKLLAQLVWVISHASIEIYKIRVEIIVYFKVSGRLVKKDPASAAEHLDISVTGVAKT